MAGTLQGGKNAAATNKAKDPDFYVKIGALGGSTKTSKLKGFAANPELASKVGAIGGAISKRRKKT